MARPAALAARNASERKVEKWHTCCLLFPPQPGPCRFCVLLPACLLPRAGRTRALLRSTAPAKLVLFAQSTVEARRQLHRERMKTCWKKRLHRKQFIRRKTGTHRKRFTLRKLEERKRGCKAEKCLRMGLRPRVSNCVGECPSVFSKRVRLLGCGGATPLRAPSPAAPLQPAGPGPARGALCGRRRRSRGPCRRRRRWGRTR